MNKTSVSITTLLAIILIAGILSGCTAPQPTTTTETDTESDSQKASLTITDSDATEGTPSAETSEASLTITEPNEEEDTVVADKPELPEFETVQEAVDFILVKDPAAALYFRVEEKPENHERVAFGPQELNLAPDGISTSAYILAGPSWDEGHLSDMHTYYLEIEGPAPCWTEPDCDEPPMIDWYGPFESQLALDIQ